MASVNTQFSIAVHLLVALAASEEDMTSSRLAESINAYPTFVRRILSKLAKANLVKTTTGKSGCCCLKKKPAEINLLDIYEAVEAPKVFAIHEYPSSKKCEVSKGIKFCMENVLDKTQKAMESSLRKTTLHDVMKDLTKCQL